jgi:hypothetical protein
MRLIGKILLGILVIIALILIVVGFTIYQASGVIRVATEESAKIQNNSQLLVEQKDCSRLTDIEDSILKIESTYSGACKNPIFNFAVKRIESVPVKCENLSVLRNDFQKEFDDAKLYCDADGKLNESIISGSVKKEELMALAQKYGIKI